MARSNGSVQHLTQHDSDWSVNERFKNFDVRYPVCCEFIPRRKNSKICQCNRHFKLHKDEINISNRRNGKLEKLENVRWDQNIHTRYEREGAHGRLINNAWYARFDTKTELETIKQLLFDVWKFPKPKLIISIIGGTDQFILNDRLETNFINGIINVAIRSDIWMITNGYNNGLVQLVGQAIQKAKLREPEHEIIAIAICKWGSIKNSNELIKPKDKESIQKTKTDTSNSSDDDDDEDDDDDDDDDNDDDDDDDDDDKVEIRKNTQHDLDMNHTHYLMLDDAKYRNVDTENYRTSLCRHIIEKDREEDIHTPIVTVVAEGGDATIANIYNDLKANIPVVIIDGTGRVADFFSRWLVYTKDIKNKSKDDEIYGIEELTDKTPVKTVPKQKTSKRQDGITDVTLKLHEVSVDLGSKTLSNLFSKYKTQLTQDLEQVLAYNDDFNVKNHNAQNNNSTDKLTLLCEQVMYCLQPAVRSNITVFNLNSENDLSATIFRSISTSYKKLWVKKKDEYKSKTNNNRIKRDGLLELTMDWDSIDIAKEFVFENSLENITNVNRAFRNALEKDLFNFVHEFIKLGVNPARIYFPGSVFTDGNNRYNDFIEDLYGNKSVDNGLNQLKSFMETSEKRIDSTNTLNVILRTLIGDYMYKLYFDSFEEEEEDRIQNGLIKKSNGKGQHKPRELESIDILLKEEKKRMPYDYIMRDLFIWSILTNRIDMAKVFLSHMKYRMCPALIATKIFKQYHHKAPYGDLRKSYEESAKYFEQYAVDCLDKCDDHDAAKACEIVLQQNELYGYVTCLQVADDAKDELFIATPCCVEAMYNIWFDKLHPNQTEKSERLSIFLGFISLGIIAPPLVSYRDGQQSEQGETLKRTLRSCGIDYCDPYPLEFPRYFKSNLQINHYMHRVKNFHQSLLMKFVYHFASYCFFLLLFSYVLLFNFSPPTNQSPSIHWTEILTIILVSCMLIEEIHYFVTQDSLTFFGKLNSYSRDKFKSMTLIAFVLFYIGLIVRFTYANSEDEFIAARVIMAIDVEIWWLRLLSFIIVIPSLGPYLVAIKEMLKDLLFFLCIIAVVMIAYGVASRSMVYYPVANNFTTATGGFIDTSFDGRSVFRQIAYPVYFFLHGQFSNELATLDSNPNAGWSIATQVLFALHMLLVNILLVNLLIAMFSKRFDQVYDDSINIWHSQQYLFIREYYTRAPLFPPISLVYDIYYLCRIFIFFVRLKILHKSGDHGGKIFKMIPKNRQRIKDWYDFECAATYEYAHDEVKAASTKLSSEQDSSNTDTNDEIMNNQKDSSEILQNLRQVKENVTRLNVTIGRMDQ